MRKCFALAVLLFIFTFPITAFAGHTYGGVYCSCSSASVPCMPDHPDEVMPECGSFASADDSFDTSTLMLAFAGLLLVWKFTRV